MDDVVTFPGRMYAFVNYRATEEAVAAFAALQDTQLPELTGAAAFFAGAGLSGAGFVPRGPGWSWQLAACRQVGSS